MKKIEMIIQNIIIILVIHIIFASTYTGKKHKSKSKEDNRPKKDLSLEDLYYKQVEEQNSYESLQWTTRINTKRPPKYTTEPYTTSSGPKFVFEKLFTTPRSGATMKFGQQIKMKPKFTYPYVYPFRTSSPIQFMTVQVSVYVADIFRCSGTLITRKFVLTAAKCVTDPYSSIYDNNTNTMYRRRRQDDDEDDYYDEPDDENAARRDKRPRKGSLRRTSPGAQRIRLGNETSTSESTTSTTTSKSPTTTTTSKSPTSKKPGFEFNAFGGGTVSVRYGSRFLYYGGTQDTVLKIFLHPEYDYKTHNKDLALLLLVHCAQLGYSANTLDLHLKCDEIEVGDAVLVPGWGFYTNQDGADTLAAGASVKGNRTSIVTFQRERDFIFSPKICSRLFKKRNDTTSYFPVVVNGSHWCASYAKFTVDFKLGLETGMDLESRCEGDAGGPAVWFRYKSGYPEFFMIGVVLFRRGCLHPKYPTLINNICNDHKWIQIVTSNMTDYCEDDIEILKEKYILEKEPISFASLVVFLGIIFFLACCCAACFSKFRGYKDPNAAAPTAAARRCK